MDFVSVSTTDELDGWMDECDDTLLQKTEKKKLQGPSKKKKKKIETKRKGDVMAWKVLWKTLSQYIHNGWLHDV